MDHPSLTKRSRERESMDDARVDQGVLAAEYRFLSRFNRATAAANELLRTVQQRLGPASSSFSLVDFGAGGGDIARELVRLAQQHGVACSCLCVDISEQAVNYARQHSTEPSISFQVADLLQGSSVLGQGAADVAHASLVLHHLEDAQVVRALSEMAKVATRLVVWNDLVRDRAGIAGAFLSTLFERRELRRDAVVSVRRSFTLDEARMMAEAAGLEDVQVARLRGARFVLSGRPGPQAALQQGRPMLRVSDLCFSYGQRSVLRGVNLTGRAGQCLLVSGANGAGKSTLLACVAGVLPTTQGQIWLDRTQTAPGYLPQEGGLFSALSAASNLQIAGRLAGLKEAGLEAAVRQAVEEWGLSQHVQRPVHTLSGGLRRRVALACTLVHQPNALVLDEPDAGLDVQGLEALARAVSRTVHAGGLAMVATHKLTDQQLGLTADRVVGVDL